MDLAIPCEHGGAELNELRGEEVCILILRVDAGGCQTHDPRVVGQDAGGHECVPGAVAAEVHPDVDAPWAAGLVRRPEETPIPGGNAVRKGPVDDTARCSPLAEDKAVIVDRARVLLFQLSHELRRQSGVVVDGVGLTVDVRVAVQKLLEPVLWVIRVAGAVKMAVRTGQTAFQHLKYALVPCGDLVPIGVLEGSTLNAGNVLFVVGTQHVHLAAEQLHDVAGRRGAHHAHKLRTPEGPHGLQHVAFQRAEGVAQHDAKALVPGRADALGDGNSAVQIGLAGAGGPSLDVPAVGAIAKELLLKLSQWHCPHLPAACGQLPVHPLPGPPARSPRPASSAAPRRHGHHRAWRLQ